MTILELVVSTFTSLQLEVLEALTVRFRLYAITKGNKIAGNTSMVNVKVKAPHHLQLPNRSSNSPDTSAVFLKRAVSNPLLEGTSDLPMSETNE